MLQGEAFLHRGLADPVPGDITLADVHYPLGIVHQVVNLPLQNGLVVFLHLAAGYLNHHSQGQLVALFAVGEVLAYYLNQAVFHRIHIRDGGPLHTRGATAAAFHEKIILADALSLEGRTVGNRYRNLGDGNLQTTHLDGSGRHLLMQHIRYHVLVGTNTGWQNLRNVRVRQGGETPVDCPGRIGSPFGIYLTQGVDKGENTILVVFQHALVVPRLDATESHAGPVGKTQSENRSRNIRAKGHQPGVPADLHPSLNQLLGKGGTALVGTHEHIEVLLLVLFGDELGRFRIRSRTHYGSKPRGAAIDKLDTALAHDNVMGSSHPELPGCCIRILLSGVEIRIFNITDRLCYLLCQNGCHPGIQGMAQIGHMNLALHVGRKQLANPFHYRFSIGQSLNLRTQKRIDNGQVIGGVGKFNLLLRAVLF